MKTISLIEYLDAAHHTHLVSTPYVQRGGILVIAPPSSLKSTILDISFRRYPNALILSDLNVQTLMQLKSDLNRHPTIVFPAFEKLYARNPATASNVEGYLMGLIEEGFTKASFEDSRMFASVSRAMIVAATTDLFYHKHFTAWLNSGFLRRFIVMFWTVENEHKIIEAIHKWELLSLDSIHRKEPMQTIPMLVSDEESKWLERLLRDQLSPSPLVLLKKICTVLKWKYAKTKEPEKWKDILKDITPVFSKTGGKIEL